MPAHLEFRDALPKTAVGKLSKKELIAEERQQVKPPPSAGRDPGDARQAVSATGLSAEDPASAGMPAR